MPTHASQKPEVAVGGLIFNREHKLFFMTSPKWHGGYTIPGGRGEYGETLEAALIRECREETGLRIYDIRPLGFQESLFNPEYHQRRHFIFFDFACRTDDTEVTLNEEGIDFIWVTIEEATQLPMGVTVRKLLDTFLKQISKE